MRTSAGNKVWGGVGVYTILEIFFDAGKFMAQPMYDVFEPGLIQDSLNQ